MNTIVKVIRRVMILGCAAVLCAPTAHAAASSVDSARPHIETPDSPKLPARSGKGRRVVYSISRQHVWVVGKDGQVIRDFPASGKRDRPLKGKYQVLSQRIESFSLSDPTITFRYMTRFAEGLSGVIIGFHEIPRKNGVPVQSEKQLSTPQGGGCVRLGTEGAKFIYDWAKPGTQVVVVS